MDVQVAPIELTLTGDRAPVMAALYAVSPWGDADQYIPKDGWIGTYAPRLQAGHD